MVKGCSDLIIHFRNTDLKISLKSFCFKNLFLPFSFSPLILENLSNLDINKFYINEDLKQCINSIKEDILNLIR